ncbi:MAG: hypothetical protein KDE47_26185 [Caldilineaceae bacterium]|nr:hypothetical protein [Caldilineaceae bacterium]
MVNNQLTSRSQLSQESLHSRVKAIDATYYNITNVDGWPIAGLLVLLDSGGHAVRAELQFADGIDEQQQDIALRQGKSLLQRRYARAMANTSTLELRVLETYQYKESLHIQLPISITDTSEGYFNWLHGIRWPYWAAGAALLFALIVGIITLPTLLRGTGTTGVVEVTPAVGQSEQAVEGQAATTDQSAAVVPAVQPEVHVDPFVSQTNNLPTSTNANPNLAVGMRVRIRPTYALSLRSEPGATAGRELGHMKDGEEALIIGGPYWLEGNSDTIVWWYVQLDNGVEAWAAANTSELTLLEPVQ